MAMSNEHDMFSLMEALLAELNDPEKYAKSKEGKVTVWGDFMER